VLHAVDTQHGGQRIGATTVASLGVMGLNHCDQSRPWNQLFHASEKLLFAGLAALAVELSSWWSMDTPQHIRERIVSCGGACSQIA